MTASRARVAVIGAGMAGATCARELSPCRRGAAGVVAQEPFWYDDDLGLGTCGDHLGGAGVEGAWMSGNALGERIASACERSPRSLQRAGAVP